MFYIMDAETEITIAMTAYEDAANEIAQRFENTIVRYVEGNSEKTKKSLKETLKEMRNFLKNRR